MARIIVSENVTVDGVVDDPNGEDATAHGGWFSFRDDGDRQAWADLELAEAEDSSALLLGRRSDEQFSARWSGRDGDWALRLNAMPKFVVSSTRAKPVWSNSTVLSGDPAAQVARLKRELDGDIVVYGSLRLVRTLLDSSLVDELRLLVHPVVAGEGRRLFPRSDALELIDARTIGSRMVLMRYGFSR